jgi:hypothetical protein
MKYGQISIRIYSQIISVNALNHTWKGSGGISVGYEEYRFLGCNAMPLVRTGKEEEISPTLSG